MKKIAEPLVKIAVEISGAEVGSLRSFGADRLAHLVGEPVWKPSVPHFGQLKRAKHLEDCYPEPNYKDVVGRVRTEKQNQRAQNRPNGQGEPFYSQSEIEHFTALGSEAFIFLHVDEGVPKGVIVLGHRDKSHFDPKAARDTGQSPLQILQFCKWLFDSLYVLADLVQDRGVKADLLREVAKCLPEIAAAPTLQAFARALLTVMTCGQGFQFERALFFWLDRRQLPAVCKGAVGGIDHSWPQQRIPIGTKWDKKPLSEFVHEAILYPVPGDVVGDVPDPLYHLTYDSLTFRATDGGVIGEMLQNPPSDGSARKLTNSDPFISRIRREMPGVFINDHHNEYFAFPLRPLGVDENEVLGFVICDLTFRPQAHSPGLGFPDLTLCGFVCNLIARLRQAAESNELLLYMLQALPYVRHGAPKLHDVHENLVNLVSRLRSEFEGVLDRTILDRIDVQLKVLGEVKRDYAIARKLAEGHRDLQPRDAVEDLDPWLSGLCRHAEELFENLTCRVNSCGVREAIRIRPETLESILMGIMQNASEHGRDDTSTPISVTFDVAYVKVPQSGQYLTPRCCISVCNNGKSISEQYKDFLFCDDVSSASHNGRGTGLSTGRLQAKAYGGDVFLLSHDPVRFDVVLEPLCLRQTAVADTVELAD